MAEDERQIPGGEDRDSREPEGHGRQRSAGQRGWCRSGEHSACRMRQTAQGSCTAAAGPDESEERLLSLSQEEVQERGAVLAAEYLRHRGYRIEETGWECGEGTVDVVADDDGTRVLVTVKSAIMLGSEVLAPEIPVSYRDFWHARRLALLYLADHFIEEVRFDIISIGIVGVRHARLRHLVGLYTWEDEPEQEGLYLMDRRGPKEPDSPGGDGGCL